MKIKTYYLLLNLLFIIIILDSFLITCGIILSINLITNPLKNQLKKQ